MKIATTIALILASWLSATVYATNTTSTSPAERTFSHVLENGMNIIVREDHRAPVVVARVWDRVGSS